MMSLLKNLRRRGVQVVLVVSLLAVTSLGCGRQRPERTEDPAEIEELRQEHLRHAERERQESS